MRINHNIPALQSHHSLLKSGKKISKSMERLNTGTKINRSSDDPAGLAISNKMRNQIKGLESASRNSLDAVSLVQTADGALSEVHNMLQRLRELALQAGTDTLEIDDRQKIQAEVTQLTEEINDVANKTSFNTRKIFSSAFEGLSGISFSSENAGLHSVQNEFPSGVVDFDITKAAQLFETEIAFNNHSFPLAADIQVEITLGPGPNAPTYTIDLKAGDRFEDALARFENGLESYGFTVTGDKTTGIVTIYSEDAVGVVTTVEDIFTANTVSVFGQEVTLNAFPLKTDVVLVINDIPIKIPQNTDYVTPPTVDDIIIRTLNAEGMTVSFDSTLNVFTIYSDEQITTVDVLPSGVTSKYGGSSIFTLNTANLTSITSPETLSVTTGAGVVHTLTVDNTTTPGQIQTFLEGIFGTGMVDLTPPNITVHSNDASLSIVFTDPDNLNIRSERSRGYTFNFGNSFNSSGTLEYDLHLDIIGYPTILLSAGDSIADVVNTLNAAFGTSPDLAMANPDGTISIVTPNAFGNVTFSLAAPGQLFMTAPVATPDAYEFNFAGNSFPLASKIEIDLGPVLGTLTFDPFSPVQSIFLSDIYSAIQSAIAGLSAPDDPEDYTVTTDHLGNITVFSKNPLGVNPANHSIDPIVSDNNIFTPADPAADVNNVTFTREDGTVVTLNPISAPGDDGFEIIGYNKMRVVVDGCEMIIDIATRFDKVTGDQVLADGSVVDNLGNVTWVDTQHVSATISREEHHNLEIQVGPNKDMRLTIELPSVNCAVLGIEGIDYTFLDDAQDAIDRCDDAISMISDYRANLGSYQNRLEYTVESLDTTAISIADAVSRIADTDMALEMSMYTQQSVIYQAAISIMAQANQMPQLVLQLLNS